MLASASATTRNQQGDANDRREVQAPAVRLAPPAVAARLDRRARFAAREDRRLVDRRGRGRVLLGRCRGSGHACLESSGKRPRLRPALTAGVACARGRSADDELGAAPTRNCSPPRARRATFRAWARDAILAPPKRRTATRCPTSPRTLVPQLRPGICVLEGDGLTAHATSPAASPSAAWSVTDRDHLAVRVRCPEAGRRELGGIHVGGCQPGRDRVGGG